MNEIKISLISLGCEKNLVDSEMMLGFFKKHMMKIVDDISKSDIIVINTCGFIESAKQEAIDTIFDVLPYQKEGKKIVVTGCLVQRYLDDLKKEIPEVDLWIPIRDYIKFGDLLIQLLQNIHLNCSSLTMEDRCISTPSHLAYVKISEGCNNRCTYCAIPLIRGNFVSRKEEDILKEIRELVSLGYKEICLISQDSSNYGYDIHSSLASLLKKIVKIEGNYWIRILYLYPDEITNEFIDVVKENSKVLPYFDIPIQHASNKILNWMHRRGNKEYISKLMGKIRNEIPNAVIRTTLIVGFPHETEKDFQELLTFIKENPFDHLGAFTYSKEEDTPSYSMSCQVSSKVKQQRLDKVMDVQRWISLDQNKKYLNKTYDCIIESYDDETKQYYGRTYMFAPDDIDGGVIINAKKELEIGKIYPCYIYDVDFYDIYGRIDN